MSPSGNPIPQRLSTSRLVLRELRAQDAPGLFAAYAHEDYEPRFVRWPVHQQVADTQAFVARSLTAIENGQLLAYVLTLGAAEAVPIGMLEARTGGGTLDLGYVLARAHWGHGFMPEAVCAFTAAALALPNVWRVQAVCDTENTGSVRTLQKAGFALEGRLERYVMYPKLSPAPRACFMFARCK